MLHPRPEAVMGALFHGREPLDKVQIKYEIPRAHIADGTNVTAAAAAHGYSRAAFCLAADDLVERGMLGLLDEYLDARTQREVLTRTEYPICILCRL